MLTEEEKEEIKKLLKRRSKHTWTDKKCDNTIRLLEQIRSGQIRLSEMLPGGCMSYEDYLFERDLLKYAKPQNKEDPAITT